jgi:hypothetical protein
MGGYILYTLSLHIPLASPEYSMKHNKYEHIPITADGGTSVADNMGINGYGFWAEESTTSRLRGKSSPEKTDLPGRG